MRTLDRVRSAFFPQPISKERRSELRHAALAALGGPTQSDGVHQQEQFFELYKMMVQSSEALVSRRQAVNTFFTTINGLMLTAIGLFVQSEGQIRLQAGGVLVLALAGASMCFAWRTLLVSFGQLNTGKFVIINAMEESLAAAIYAAEWEALGRGEDDSVYRSFTARETWIPVLLAAIYVVAAGVGGVVWTGIWSP